MANPGVTPLVEIGKRTARIKVSYVREAIGEFFGTLILTFMCVGASGQYVVKNHNGFESQIVPVLGIILGIMIATVTTGGLSGAHINPAVTISLAVAGELSWYSVPGYVISQFIGAIVGALLGWSLVHPILRHTFGIAESLSIPEVDMAKGYGIAGIFSPLRSGVTVANGLCTELVLTCLLIMAVCAALDKQSSFKPPKYLLSIIFPLTIAGFAFSHDMPSGTLLNPARDLGPRIAAWILGWDSKHVFQSVDWNNNEQQWWLVGLFGPIVGGVLGALIYAFIIGPQQNFEHVENDADESEVPAAIPEGNDWRSTVFVPKPQVMTSPQPPLPQPQQYMGGGYPNNNNNAGGYQPPQSFQGGYNNQGYPRKDY